MSKESKSTDRKRKVGREPVRHYDFSKGEVGRYAKRLASDQAVRVRVVQLDPDVSEVFGNSAAVNSALRGLMRIMHDTEKRKAS